MIPRNHLYCGLIVVGLANGMSEKIVTSVTQDGVTIALFHTFGVSVVVWIAGIVTLSLLWRAEVQPAGKLDFAVAAVASVAFLFPAPTLSWLAIAGIALFLGRSPKSSRAVCRAAALLGALTVPMLWARILFAAMSNYILAADAKLVSLFVGTESNGNTIPFADGSGVLFLEPACSSLTNVSLALLCGVLFLKVYDRPWSAGIVRTIFIACCVTVGINVLRIGSIGLFPAYYDLIHGPVGATLSEWTMIIAVVGVYANGIKAAPRGVEGQTEIVAVER
jgi:exosortase/archaeosortase family protein